MLWKCCTQYASKSGKQQWLWDWKRWVFIPIPKKGNAKECSNYCTVELISHASEVMLKILQARLQQYVNCELPDVQAGFRKAEEPEIKLPTSIGSSKKQESSRKTSISVLLTMPKPLTVWIAINCGKFWKRWEWITDHLTCLLRNLYAGQEATVRTRHGTTDWFQTGKGLRQGCDHFPRATSYTLLTLVQSQIPGKIITSRSSSICLSLQCARHCLGP